MANPSEIRVSNIIANTNDVNSNLEIFPSSNLTPDPIIDAPKGHIVEPQVEIFPKSDLSDYGNIIDMPPNDVIGNKVIGDILLAEEQSAQIECSESKNSDQHFKGENKKSFNSLELLNRHYEKHGQEIASILNKNNYSVNDYLEDANYIINNGQYSS